MWQFFGDSRYLAEEYASVNVIMLAVISGLIGLVLSGFTGWHLWLCYRGMTTIECLEKTRYLSGVRGRIERNRLEQHRRGSEQQHSEELMDRVRRAGDQLLEFHANAVPGASRFEEGEERLSPAPSLVHHAVSGIQDEETGNSGPLYHDHPPNPDSAADTPAIRALRASYHNSNSQPLHPRGPPGRFNYRLGVHEYETSREQQRYDEYMEDKEDEKLPNAFDLGWRRNLIAVFGQKWWAWFLPICNSPGDGWRWEVSDTWRSRKDEGERVKAERILQQQQQQQGRHNQAQGYDGAYDAHHHRHGDAGHYTPPREDHYYQNHDVGHHQRSDQGPYSHSATSLSTLTPSGRISSRSSARGRGRAWGGRYKKDVDRSGEDGEPGEFEVSGDSAAEDEHDEEYSDSERLRKQGSWERDWD